MLISLTHIELNEFLTHFEMLIKSTYNLISFLVILISNFNTTLKKWKSDDIDTNEGIRMYY